MRNINKGVEINQPIKLFNSETSCDHMEKQQTHKKNSKSVENQKKKTTKT